MTLWEFRSWAAWSLLNLVEAVNSTILLRWEWASA